MGLHGNAPARIWGASFAGRGGRGWVFVSGGGAASW